MDTGLTHLSKSNLEWQQVDRHGVTMHKAILFEGAHGVRSAFFKMPAGLKMSPHTHTKWVQVAVLEGRMRVEQQGSQTIEVEGGGVYFLNPGHEHVETALLDTIVLVTQGEDRHQSTKA
jgi:quercetin dioxygenase-like cupin family protein